MDHTYWQTQSSTKPLFPDIEWSRPERRDQAGKLGIVGGNKLGFVAVAEGYATVRETGAGAVRVLLPDALKKTVSSAMTDVIFAATTPSGSLARAAQPELHALASWADGMLLIGDAGRNSETAITYEQFITDFEGQLTITRDAIDLVKNASGLLVERPNTLLVASFAQIQKLFQSVYYPKILTFSMHLQQLVEALHKFTTTYPVTIMTLHREQMIIASNGDVVTMEYTDALRIWRGTVATQAAVYWLWNPGRPLEAATTSLIA